MNPGAYTRRLLARKLLAVPVGTRFSAADIGLSRNGGLYLHLQAFVGTLIRNIVPRHAWDDEGGERADHLFERIPQNGDLPR